MQPTVNGYRDLKLHLNLSNGNGNVNCNNGDGDDHRRTQLEKLLYNTTKRLLIISQIFLCSPTGVHKPKPSNGFRPLEKLLYRLHLLWCLGLYIGLALCVYDEYTSSNIELPTVQKPLYFSEYLVYLVHLLDIILASHLGHENFWTFHNFFIDFDRKLLDLKLQINYLDLGVFLHRHLCLIVLHFMCTVIIGYFYSAGIWINFIRTNTVYILPNIIIQISLIHYYALLFMIANRSEKVYYLLENLLRKSHSYDILTLRHQLHTLRSLYARLEQFTRDVNDAFSYSIILVYFGSFINISINIFLLYKYFNAWSTSDVAWTAYSVAWICMHIGKMTLILYYNQRIQDKVIE